MLQTSAAHVAVICFGQSHPRQVHGEFFFPLSWMKLCWLQLHPVGPEPAGSVESLGSSICRGRCARKWKAAVTQREAFSYLIVFLFFQWGKQDKKELITDKRSKDISTGPLSREDLSYLWLSLLTANENSINCLEYSFLSKIFFKSMPAQSWDLFVVVLFLIIVSSPGTWWEYMCNI